MRVACISAFDAPADFDPDIIVLPEYSDQTLVMQVAQHNPRAIVAAAIEERGRSRGLLLQSGRNQIDYLKIGTDGRTHGTGRVPFMTVRLFGNLAVGVVVCMDSQEANFVNALANELRETATQYKVLCIPADMGGEWLS